MSLVSAPPTWPVQKAVYALLTADPELSGLLVGGVYDYTPETAPYPFLVIGEAVDTPDNRLDGFGWQTLVTLHVWTQAEGNRQGLEIGARVTALLDHQPLTLPGYAHVATRHEFGQTLVDPEPPGNIRHLVQRYRVITEQPTT